jgi:hypothetical protein
VNELWTRRRFLASVLAVAVAACTRGPATEATSSASGEVTTTTQPGTTLPPSTLPPQTVPNGDPTGSLEGVHALGRAYLREHPEEADADRLAADLGIEGRPDLPQLAERVAAEFAAGDVVAVDGWRLAVSEARAAALMFLTEQ